MESILSNLKEIVAKSSDGYAVYLAKTSIALIEKMVETKEIK